MALYQIHFSPTGGTKKCAAMLAQGFHSPSQEIDLTDRSADFTQYQFSGEDICIVAVPSYGGRVPETAASRIRLLPGNGAAAVLLAVYGNRAYEDTLRELQELLTADGFRCLAAVAAVAEHSILRQFAAGRPDEADAGELTSFGEQIAQAVSAGKPAALSLPGNSPYREYGGVPLHPKAGKSCVECGLCAASCPVGAIPEDKPSQTDDAKCISCMRCISVCPGQARSLNKLALAAVSQKLKKVCGGRRENELFL